MNKKNLITEAIDLCGVMSTDNESGVMVIANECGVVRQAVKKWEKNGLPDTDFSGKTNYSEIIQRITGNQILSSELLAWTKRYRK